MSQWSQPWDGLVSGDATRAPYSATEWDDMYESLFGSLDDCGVIPGIDGELEVSGAATPVSVAAGAGMVLGKFFRNTVATDLGITSPTGATRRDWIVLRCCWVSTGTCSDALYSGSGEVCGPQKIRICHKQNPDEDLTPPALEKTDGIIWEIPLAQIDVTVGGVITVTDLRQEIYGPETELFFGIGEIEGVDATFDLLGCGWRFDSTVDENAVISFRIPDQYRGESFRLWYIWYGEDAPANSDVVGWLATMEIVDCDEGIAVNGSRQGSFTISADDTLYCSELVTDGVFGPTMDFLAPGKYVRLYIIRDADAGIVPDDYGHDAILWGVRIKMV